MRSQQSAIFQLIRSEPRCMVDRLYHGVSVSSFSEGEEGQNKVTPWAAQAVFQSLSRIAQIITMKIIFADCSFTLSDLCLFICVDNDGDVTDKTGKTSIQEEVMEELIGMWIIVEESSLLSSKNESDTSTIMQIGSSFGDSLDSSVVKYRLNPSFQSGLQNALTNPEKPWNQESLAGQINIEVLQNHQREMWNKFLGLIVGIIKPSDYKHKVVEPFVRRFGLMRLEQSLLVITEKGYEFMLKDYASQLWDFLIDAITRHKQSEITEELLSFLFKLCYCDVGTGYPISTLTKPQKQLMFEMAEVGIVYIPEKSHLFYPTETSVRMIFDCQSLVSPSLSNLGTDSRDQIQIIVETNLQVVAYISNPLQLALLQLFVAISVRMPNMVIGRITRDKSQEAYRKGMKASQIIDFLTVHAHPVVLKRVKANKANTTGAARILPENVTDQLVMWENEMRRMAMESASVLNCSMIRGMYDDLFDELVEDMRSANLLLWSYDKSKASAIEDKSRYVIVYRPEAQQRIDEFLREKCYS